MAGRLYRYCVDPIPVLLAIGALLGAGWLGLELRRDAVPVRVAGETIVSADSVPIVLGRDDLGQHTGARSAARRHLHVDLRDARWMISNASHDRRVFARTRSGHGFYLQRWAARTGDEILFASAAIEVEEASDRLVLRDIDSGRRVSFEAGVLDPDGEAVYLVCRSRSNRFARALRWRLRDWAHDPDSEIRLFSIGGGVNCSSRWSIPALEAQSVDVRWHDGTYWVAPGRARGVSFVRDGETWSFGSRAVEVNGEDPIVRLILGRTVYAVETRADQLSLVPIANSDLWRREQPDRPMREYTWSGAGLGTTEWFTAQRSGLLVGALAVFGVSLVVLVLLARRRDRRSSSPTLLVLALSLSAFGGWTTLLTLRGEAPDASLRYGLTLASFGYASVLFAIRRRLLGLPGLLWTTAIGLALSGTLVLFALGAGAENSQWMRFFDKHALLLALFGWAAGASAALPKEVLHQSWIRLFGSEWIVASAGALLAIAMAFQLAIGNETGIGGLQPVELTKFVYVVFLAFAGMHLGELRHRDTREFRRSPLRVLLPFLRTLVGFALVVLSVIVGVRDFSPAIILGLVTLLWLYRIGRRGPGRRAMVWNLLRPSVALVLVGFVVAASWARDHPEKLPTAMPQRDRILVWSQPGLHPHSGSQVLAAMDRVSEGGWRGARHWFGPNEEVMKVPAVQDDFITAFLLNRFGGFVGLGLIGLQLVYLLLLFSVARRIERVTRSGDFREQSAGRTASFALFGLAWMHAIHWSIAWSNTLGLLPVMGQPMTWLSAGNSHLLGFTLPCLAIALMTSWVARDLANIAGDGTAR
jgi:cell division protein FtsW